MSRRQLHRGFKIFNVFSKTIVGVSFRLGARGTATGKPTSHHAHHCGIHSAHPSHHGRVHSPHAHTATGDTHYSHRRVRRARRGHWRVTGTGISPPVTGLWGGGGWAISHWRRGWRVSGWRGGH